MNEEIIKNISIELNIKDSQVKSVLKLLSEGNTVPFIARYRKEVTGALDEEVIRKINEVYEYEVNLLARKEDVIRLIDEKGMLTPELKDEILKASKLVEVEDLYRPFKEKKKTKATEAIRMGLEPLAKMMLSFKEFNLLEEAGKYLNDEVKTNTDAIQGAKYIIAENISDNALYRKYIRDNIYKYGFIKSKKKKDSEDTHDIYKNYYDFKEKISSIKSYRVLAINRGEKEKILNVSLEYNMDYLINYLEKKVIRKETSYKSEIIDSINDSLNRLILPSIEREIRSELTDNAGEVAIVNFAKNLEALLLTPPLHEKVVLALDPAYRTGCKLAVLDKIGNPVCIEVIYPTPPHEKIEESKKVVLDLIKKYDVEVVAIGNGTASRESEKFISDTLKEIDKDIKYVIVNEAGASVYSASPLGIEEFPDLTVEKRSAISIGRRLQDALSELVKIDPQSIGVGLYQHDVKEKKLSESLDFTVMKTVNQVGVDLNTASPSLLKYISGLNKKCIDTIIDYRKKIGKINSREEFRKIKGISDKVFEQSVGFLRINGDNPLDKTNIHPDNYNDTYKLLEKNHLDINDIGTDKIKTILDKINIIEESVSLNIDKYTLQDIIDSLVKPNRDPREEVAKPLLKSDVLTIDDVKIGMELEGTVRNVIDFGLFIDIGLHNDGLCHISKISKDFIKDPRDYYKVGDIVTCYVIDIDKKNEKVALSLIKENNVCN